MTSVAISPKFQVVIPRAVRQQLNLKAGQRVHVRANEAGQVVIEPELDIMSLRGILKPIPGVDITHIENDLMVF
jgi:AbrB family looped-hinge helix DNA binding protein